MKRILSFVLVAVMLFCITACGGNSPEKSLEKMLNALKKGDLETLAALQGEDDAKEMLDEIPDESKEMMKAMYSGLKYDVGKAEIKDDKATVEVEITMVDMEKVMNKLVEKAMSGEVNMTDTDEVLKAMKKLITDKDAETTTVEVEVPMVLDDGKWVIDDDGDTTGFLNAITGGLGEIMGSLGDLG